MFSRNLRIFVTKRLERLPNRRCESNKAPIGSATAASAQNEQPHSKLLQNMLQGDAEEEVRQKTDPKETSIILFPGQGTQYVGMANKLMRFPEARRIFELANDVLGYNLLKLCLEGPVEKLNRTEHAQHAVMVSSLAALEQLKEERPKAIDTCVATAGFSLGEITALVFAGVIPFDKALKLVQVRANAMQLACDQVAGGMAMVLYAPDTEIGAACAKAKQWCVDKGVENPYCGVANYMYPHCKVLAGNIEALEFLEKNSKALKIRRMKRLPVSGAFHTPLMEAAVETFAKALKKITLEEPLIRVYSNVDGKPYKHVGHILKQLPKQIVRPVKWEQTLHEMYERQQGQDFPRTFECGPGKGLTQILEKVNGKAANTAISIEA
ncbi:probable malonyl-CoA-acyl carrier protein transacylase, mitochondrial [Stomoxys calcitrans]|uniref:[acyl-carrier-protein] S-malonyltransferase n=1 Tax=Stomoxys calcitrans TaxID=35570 RepID=A0A1I8NRV3_STOCA|nr:probable malonyl-CoA-acyl carrier protein transacylase, mitochondrial [Stomoxys calcitrans]